jgi:hypothetical protein
MVEKQESIGKNFEKEDRNLKRKISKMVDTATPLVLNFVVIF